MPRRSIERRPPPQSDVRFSSQLVSRLIGKLNFTGKKNKVTRIVYEAMDLIKSKTGEDPAVVLSRGVENCRPLLETKPRQVGGATYQVPIEVDSYRGETLAMRWIIDYARARKGQPMAIKIAEEIIQASRKEGTAFKKREEMHKMAESNRAFAHYRW
ncbi:MAG: 30S ribosomal protein S7 [Elusimicrobia bacterium]|nr:30S ribosomal protein S7 [Elusimicrobiota bacterium]